MLLKYAILDGQVKVNKNSISYVGHWIMYHLKWLSNKSTHKILTYGI